MKAVNSGKKNTNKAALPEPFFQSMRHNDIDFQEVCSAHFSVEARSTHENEKWSVLKALSA